MVGYGESLSDVGLTTERTRHLINAFLMLGYCLRLWPNIKTASGRYLVFLDPHTSSDLLEFYCSLRQ